MRREQGRYFLTVGLAVFAASAWMSSTPAVVAAAPAQDASSSAGSTKNGVFTADQADRGKTTFQNVCSACHTLAEHTGKNFLDKWGGGSVGDVYDFVSSTMPDGNPSSLKPQEYIDVISFFLRETGYPDGKSELPPDAAKLKDVKIEPLP